VNPATEDRIHASASLATPVVVGADGVPSQRIQLLPMGRIVPRDGRGPWVLADAAHAAEVVAATRATVAPQDMMIDFDHQAVFATAPGKGGRAEAAGWIDPASLTVEADGIWGTATWTADAAAKLASRAYRYLSPYFGSDKASGRVTRIFNVGLVNQPAIREIAAAAAVETSEGNPSAMKTILTALGLKEDATEADACASIAALTQAAGAAETLAATATALGLKPEATGEEVTTAAAAAVAGGKGSPDPKKFVPIETYDAATAQLKVINEERAAAAVDRAIEGGKIAPANRDWALGYFLKDEAGFAAFVEQQPAVIQPGQGKATAKPAADGKPQLTDEDRAACAALGVDEAEFLKTRESETAQ